MEKVFTHFFADTVSRKKQIPAQYANYTKKQQDIWREGYREGVSDGIAAIISMSENMVRKEQHK